MGLKKRLLKKRKVFKEDLKELTEIEWRTETRSWFQITAKRNLFVTWNSAILLFIFHPDLQHGHSDRFCDWLVISALPATSSSLDRERWYSSRSSIAIFDRRGVRSLLKYVSLWMNSAAKSANDVREAKSIQTRVKGSGIRLLSDRLSVYSMWQELSRGLTVLVPVVSVLKKPCCYGILFALGFFGMKWTYRRVYVCVRARWCLRRMRREKGYIHALIFFLVYTGRNDFLWCQSTACFQLYTPWVESPLSGATVQFLNWVFFFSFLFS